MTEFFLHSFSDASEKAYGAVIYATTKYQSGKIVIRLVAAKTRVAPLASTSVPRMELMGAVLAVRLGKNVAEAFKLNAEAIEYWVDSKSVLHWICGKSRRYKSFVGNCIAEIQQHSNPARWHYISSNRKLADF